MKRGTGKNILLLAVLLAIVGGIVYAVLTWPVNPTRMKPAKSYEQLRDTVEKKTDIRVPGEDLLPWTVTERPAPPGWPRSAALPCSAPWSAAALPSTQRSPWESPASWAICRPAGTCTAMCRCTCSRTRGSIWRSCVSTAASTSSNCTIRRM